MNWPAIIIGFLVCFCSYLLGYHAGENRGRALGWLERNQEEIDRERKRRAADGTFRSVRKEVSNG